MLHPSEPDSVRGYIAAVGRAYPHTADEVRALNRGATKTLQSALAVIDGEPVRDGAGDSRRAASPVPTTADHGTTAPPRNDDVADQLRRRLEQVAKGR